LAVRVHRRVVTAGAGRRPFMMCSRRFETEAAPQQIGSLKRSAEAG
jgi:hypothetical protein